MRPPSLRTAALAVALAAAGGCEPESLPTGGPDEPELLPLERLFGNPERARVRLSADGERLAWLAPHEGVLNVWVAPTGAPEDARVVTADTARGIRRYHWAYTNRHILYLQDDAGDENFHVHAVDVESGETRNLTPLDDVRAEILEISPARPGAVLLAVNDRDPRYFDAYRVEIASGERTRVFENHRFGELTADDDLRVRFATESTDDGGAVIHQVRPDGSTEPFIDVPPDDRIGTGLVELAGETLFLLDSRGRDTAALYRMDLATGTRHLIHGSERADVSDVLLDPVTDRPQAAAVDYLRKRWTAIDPAVAPDLEYLRRIEGGEIEVVSRTLDDGRWMVALTPSDGPTSYFLYERNPETRTRSARFLFTSRPELADAPLAPMHATVIASRDGLRLPSFFTLPPGATAPGSKRPREPVPMVLLVHGGPWARTSLGYHPHHQWLANRGYAVLSVNFRGSSGFGKRFVNAGNKEWGAAMHDDLLDGVDWAVAEGIARPEAVAIMGGSYGGYATLVGLTSTPERFACGVDIVGPSNLVTLLEAIPPYWAPMRSVFAHRVGDVETEAGRELLRARSPLHRVERIERPLLIGQGANDPRAPPRESEQIVEAMRANDIPVTYVVFPDEGHGFARPENRLAFNAIADRFLERCLGGRAQPLGAERLRGSSLRVPEGAERIPALAEALSTLGEPPASTPPAER